MKESRKEMINRINNIIDSIPSEIENDKKKIYCCESINENKIITIEECEKEIHKHKYCYKEKKQSKEILYSVSINYYKNSLNVFPLIWS